MRNLAAIYRPTRLDDVVGQDQAKTVLYNHLQNKPKSSYLMCGGAGTGKTTCARIFAYELNHGKTNVLEINAANANGVDDMRQIIEDAKKKPIGTPYRIFVLDECHMLTPQAQNALLKLIEEPPSTVVILMCTTDPRKILPTITSRTLRLDFTRIDTTQVTDRLCWVLDQEGMTGYDRDALHYIAQLSNGGMRDALSMLDKVVSYDAGVNMEVVNQALGLVGFDDSFKLLSGVLSQDAEAVLRCLDKLNTNGADFKIAVQDFRRFVLNAIKSFLNVSPDLIPMPASEVAKFGQYAGRGAPAQLFKVLDVVNTLVGKVGYDSDPYTLTCTMFLQLVGDL